MSALRILVVDDNRSAADALARVLQKGGDEVETTYDGASAIARVQEARFDIVLTDLKMEPVDGMAVLQAARDLRPPVEVIVITAFGATDVAVRAMRMGARDFLTKPITVEQVATRLDRLRARNQGESDIPYVAESAVGTRFYHDLMALQGVHTPLWIEGELGSGRQRAARELHRATSPDSPWLVRNLGQPDAPWPEEGTVLLPQVDSLPDDLQAALSRALWTKPSRLRLISTAALGAATRVGSGLRAELYYQLAVLTLRVPPLRDRSAEVLPLFRSALTHFSQRHRRPIPPVSAGDAERLIRHNWPGNVRELLNLAERAVVLGRLTLSDEGNAAPQRDAPPIAEGFSVSEWLEDLEKGAIAEALRLTEGDRTAAAKLLGLERNTLRYKLNKYGLL